MSEENDNPRPLKRPRIEVADEEVDKIKGLDEYRLKELQDGEVFYVPEFIDTETATKWYEELLELDTWYQPTLKVYGKEVIQSRKIAAYATHEKMTLKYSGHVMDLHYEYPPVLRDIQDRVEEELGVKFNHVMLNMYEDGSVYIGNHRDNLENRVIASVSLGAPRTFIMTHDKLKPRKGAGTSKATRKATKSKSTHVKEDEKLDETPSSSTQTASEVEPVWKKKWVLASGSLVVMQGDTQKNWKHEIPKELSVKEGRISLTFRQLVF